MFLQNRNLTQADELFFPESPSRHWGACSETGRLTDVLLSAPAHLEMVPCNAVTRENLAKGLDTEPVIAARQHRAFAAALTKAGVRCEYVKPLGGMPDLSFTRDSVVIGPWGLFELRPAAEHRRAETRHVAATVRALGVPTHARIEDGTIEGGDVCLLREGLVVIGHSNQRTTEAGARALGDLFEDKGWEVIHTRFDPKYLHLDTIMTMAGDDCAVICPAALEEGFVNRLRRLGLDLIEASTDEVARLGVNLLSLGGRRVVAAAGGNRLNAILAKHGFEVIPVEIDQFTRCGGGPHCLTMPLARLG